MVLSLAAAGAAVFGGILPAPFRNGPLEFLCVPILGWAAYRFGPREAATISAATAAIALAGTVLGFGPFVPGAPGGSLALVQGFVAISTVMPLVLAAVVWERKRAEEDLLRARDELESNVRQRTDALSGANEQLRKEIGERQLAERLFRAVAETANDGIVSTDARGKILFFNAAAQKIFGYEGDELMGRPVELLVHERHRTTRAEGPLFRTPSTPIGVIGRTEETTGKRKDGTEFPLDLSVSTWSAGGETFFTAVARDISRRRLAEERLRDSERRLEEAQALAHIGSWHRDPASEAMTWSDELFRIYGLEPGSVPVTYAWFLERTHQEDRRSVETVMTRCLETSEPFELDYRIVRPDGSERWIRGRGRMTAGPDGGAGAMYGTCEDVTERKEADLSAARLAAIVEWTDAAIVGTTIEGNINSWNPGAERLYGYAAHEVMGWPISLLAPPGHKDEPSEHFERLERGERVECETRQARKDGTVIDVSLTVSAIRGAEGRIAGFSQIARDIGETKRAAEERQTGELIRSQLDELSRHTREMKSLNDMSDILRAALSLAEAYPVIPRFLGELFPEESGALYVLNDSGRLLEAVAAWGNASPREEIFPPEECWALRLGQVYGMESAPGGVRCQHVAPETEGSSLCIPIAPRGETLGLLHLRIPPARESSWSGAESPVAEYQNRLARAAAEQIALALANVKLQETLRAQASRDPLTGLFNRRHMESSLERELYRAYRRKSTLGIVMLDLDHFKKFNDRFGHEAGDSALREVAALLARRSRGEDIVCRYGGEEFLLVLPECSLSGLRARAEQIREEIRGAQLRPSGRIRSLTASLGVALYPDHGATAVEVIRAADAALYRSKSEGRNRVTLAEP
jgi:diguanylate cyclase (GGDEF)-like protein/PAS domain S-box-containing protein